MIDVIRGSSKDKPEASRILAETLQRLEGLSGYLYIGYPIMGSPTGPVKFDALLMSRQYGLVAFDLVEGMDVADFRVRQDEIASMLDVKLKPYSKLKTGRSLQFDINVVTFAPAKKTENFVSEPPYFVANEHSLLTTLSNFRWPFAGSANDPLFGELVAAIQVVSSIRSGRQKREPVNSNSKGARLKRVEDSIANLDQHQSQAVIETVEGVQRIRGLAGSGKTIILALKVAYLHSQNEDWRIAVTFNTRSLKEQFKRLINLFTIEQTGREPDWDCIDILNAWGGPGDKERDGIYHKFCRAHSLEFLDFSSAKNRFGDRKHFAGACTEALAKVVEEHPLYDVILVDEAQDFPPEFLRLCYRFLCSPKRLVYAYDELQTLTGDFVLPPEELFGKDSNGEPLVRLNTDETSGPRQDIILEKCYRNSRPVLATAHALGFGVYRQKGLVQFFEQDSLWSDVGYVVEDGDLEGGKVVTLGRTSDTSPIFLEDHSPIDELIQFQTFESSADQTAWLAQAIKDDIRVQELRPEDIVVINPNPLTTQKEVGPVRNALFAHGINSELAGVSTSTDVFSKAGAVTFTGIFRAKGNEAGMVYIINAQDCFTSWSPAEVALVRNRLFTAITRSKAWVQILGVGPNMEALKAEWEQLKAQAYRLRFLYPTDDQKRQLHLINKELVGRPRKGRNRFDLRTHELYNAVKRGEFDPDEVIRTLEMMKAARDKS
ncbi:helicase [Herbaspirillum hiltneri N3]|uniref:DNA 3'-5' helicase II n=1 Tax=Herbaspirillum hiltneri N3 TaxID=1262470 RepID=A0ABN4HZQ5_9BURK|nr:ATP-binding domain-containing protein [Herbaspirillum hiltneri]AKZ64270.1 helicase [Herbaspirillum hiltneri N3]